MGLLETIAIILGTLLITVALILAVSCVSFIIAYADVIIFAIIVWLIARHFWRKSKGL